MTDAPEIVRTLEIRAPRDTVFRYFTDPARWAAWWGEGSTVDPRPGGKVLIRYPNGATASGSVRELEPPSRFVFTFGNESPAGPIPPGGSTVTILLEVTRRGTRLLLRHTGFPSAEVAGDFVQGWRYQLSVFSKVVTAEAHVGAAAAADRWFAAWTEPDASRHGLRGYGDRGGDAGGVLPVGGAGGPSLRGRTAGSGDVCGRCGAPARDRGRGQRRAGLERGPRGSARSPAVGVASAALSVYGP